MIQLKKSMMYVGLVLAGLFVGYLIFAPSSETHSEHSETDSEEQNVVYTCSMHPQIRQENPGKCPLCGMDLTPLSATSSMNETQFVMTEDAMKLAEISTQTIQATKATKTVRLPAEIVVNREKKSSITAQFDGRISALKANYLGKRVQKNDVIATVYSAELIEIHRELIEAVKRNETSFVQSVEERLLQLQVDKETIENMKKAGKTWTEFPIKSQTTGVVTSLEVNEQQRFMKGEKLMELDDISQLWVEAKAFESDAIYFNKGQQVEVLLANNQRKKAVVSFVEPVMNVESRTVTIRMDLDNAQQNIKVGQLAEVLISVDLTKALFVPKSAILWTGVRSIVYVQVSGKSEPTFELREVQTGAESNDKIEIISGVQENEKVVVNGVFRLDSAVQLAGLPSMMTYEKQVKSNGTSQNTTEQFGLPDNSKNQFQRVLKTYLKLKEELVKSDVNATKTAIKELDKALDAVDHSNMEPDLHTFWMDWMDAIQPEMVKMKKSSDLGEIRHEFITVSNRVIDLVKQVNLVDKAVFVQFCPMANSDNGAFWLSEQKEIRNPYYGSMMLNCGEIVSEIKKN